MSDSVIADNPGDKTGQGDLLVKPPPQFSSQPPRDDAENVGTTSWFASDTRNADLTFAAGDVVAFLAARPTAPPVAFEQLDGNVYNCLGWLDTSGYTFGLNHTTKDIGAAGTLSAIRTVITGGIKTMQFTALESLNPHVRALFDDVPVSALIPAVGRTDAACSWASGSTTILDASAVASDLNKTITGTGIPAGATIVSVTPTTVGAYTYTGYVISAPTTAIGTAASVVVGGSFSVYALPEVPQDLRYSMVFDTFDGTKQVRIFAPNAKVTARGTDQVQQGDIEMSQMTMTFYPDTFTLGGVAQRASMVRYVNYGIASPVIGTVTAGVGSGYFTAPW